MCVNVEFHHVNTHESQVHQHKQTAALIFLSSAQCNEKV